MRKLRLCLLSLLVAIPLAWSANLGTKTRAEALNEVLSTLLLGVLPLLATMLLWTEELRGADVDVRYGRDRRLFAAGHLATTLSALTAMSVIYSWVTIVLLRGTHDGLLVWDLLSTTAIAVPGALAIGTFLSAGRVWLGRFGLLALLVIAWALGPVDSMISAAVPTGHVRSLIGIGAELPIPGWGSLGILWAMGGLFGAATLLRIPR